MVSRTKKWGHHEFWSFVAAQRRRLGLRQEDVASEIDLSRPVYSRREGGEIKERPSEVMVEKLAEILELDGRGRQQLRSLAGYQSFEPDEPAVRSDSNGLAGKDSIGAGYVHPCADLTLPGPSDAPRPPQAPTALAALAIVSATLCLSLAVLIAFGPDGNPQPGAPAAVRPGGVWLSPPNGTIARGPIQLAARAYPTRPGDPPIAHVLFTVSWEGRSGAWLIACRLSHPLPRASYDDVYQCDWDPAAAGAPVGRLRVSFDVYDLEGNANHAPNGVRGITYSPSRSAAVVTIADPTDRATVSPGFISVAGKASGLQAESRIWTVVHRPGFFWPQRPAILIGDSWSGAARIGVGPGDSGKEFELIAVVVDAETDRLFAEWLSRGEQADHYPAFASLPRGAAPMDWITVTAKAALEPWFWKLPG